MRNWFYFLFEIIPRTWVYVMFECATELYTHSEWFRNKENNFRILSNTLFFSVCWLGICHLSRSYFPSEWLLCGPFSNETLLEFRCYCYKCQWSGMLYCADCIRLKSRFDAIFLDFSIECRSNAIETSNGLHGFNFESSHVGARKHD